MTSSTGAYSFTNLSTGTYVVRQVVPTGFISTTGSSATAAAVQGVVTTVNLGQFPTAFVSGSPTDDFIAGLSASGSQIQIWENASGTAAPTFSISRGMVSQLSFGTGGYRSSVTFDLGNGPILPTGGLSFDGGAGTGQLAVLGLPSTVNIFNISGGSVSVNGVSIGVTQPASVSITGGVLLIL